MRSLADRARLFSSNSSSDGRIGLREINLKTGLYSSGMIGNPGGKSGVSLAFLKVALQILSYNE
jgi:hypothetical protein